VHALDSPLFYLSLHVNVAVAATHTLHAQLFSQRPKAHFLSAGWKIVIL
jgi:hypothetical protein